MAAQSYTLMQSKIKVRRECSSNFGGVITFPFTRKRQQIFCTKEREKPNRMAKGRIDEDGRWTRTKEP